MSLTLLCDSFEILQRARTTAILSREIKKFSKQAGFDRFAYVFRATSPSSPAYLQLTDYQQNWVQEYLSRGYFEIDPIALHCARSALPAIWDDPVFHDRNVAIFWEHAQSYGLGSGLSFAVHTQPGISGLLSFSRDKRLDLQAGDLAALVGRAQVFATLLHEAVLRINSPGLASPTSAPLTARERECLKWAAEGKTAREIGQILGISQRTAVFHIDNAIQKLDAANKTQAVVRALALKIIY